MFSLVFTLNLGGHRDRRLEPCLCAGLRDGAYELQPPREVIGLRFWSSDPGEMMVRSSFGLHFPGEMMDGARLEALAKGPRASTRLYRPAFEERNGLRHAPGRRSAKDRALGALRARCGLKTGRFQGRSDTFGLRRRGNRDDESLAARL